MLLEEGAEVAELVERVAVEEDIFAPKQGSAAKIGLAPWARHKTQKLRGNNELATSVITKRDPFRFPFYSNSTFYIRGIASGPHLVHLIFNILASTDRGRVFIARYNTLAGRFPP